MKILRKILISFLILFGFIGILTGCTTNLNDEEKITVTDMLGTTVKIGKNPKRVACISRTTYDLLVAYGLGDKIDGAYAGTLNNDWVPLIYPKAKQHYIYAYKNSYELFIKRGVDLVFAPEKYIADDLNNHNIPALCVSLYGKPTFDNYVTFLSQLVTQIWDDPHVKIKAKAWENKVITAISDIKTELAKHDVKMQTIFYIRGDKDRGIGYTDNKSSFTEYAYRMMGFKFAGAQLTTNRPSIEEIININPDIFVAGGIYQNKNINLLKDKSPYKELVAVKNNQIYSIPIGFTAFEQLSAMTPVFFYDQANKLYPQYFNYDISKIIKETIKEYFNTELTDTQISYMLRGLNPEGCSLVK